MKETWLIEGKYEVISKIKQGGFGVVYYGFDKKFEKPVAIKAIEPSLLEEAKYIDMFLGEAKNAAKLNHHNIVHVYDLIKTDDGQYFIVMEYIDGVDMRRVLKKGKTKKLPLPLDLSIYIIKEVCKALEYAHNKRDVITQESLKLVHQDISPSNIMVSLNGNVKLIDFGIAKIRFSHNGDPRNLVLTGKLPYMAPEQLNGSTIDRRTDLFSLGSVFYEFLTGERLFQNDDVEKTIESIRKCRIDQNVLDQHEIPVSIQKIILKMLQREPFDRYHGANGIYIDLVEYLKTAGESVELSSKLGNYVKELFSDELSEKENFGQTLRPSDTEGKSIETPETLEKDIASQEKSTEAIMPTDSPDEKLASIVDTHAPEFENKPEVEITGSVAEKLEPLLGEELIEETTLKQETDATKDNLIELTDGDELKLEQEAQNLLTETQQTFVPGKRKLSTFSPSVVTSLQEEEEGEDDIKTVIDIIRLSAKSHKKPIIFSFVGCGIAFLIFMILNISFRWTGSGERIYDYLFPPAIKIDSAPVGATVYIDDEPVSSTTPLSIPKISPGVHKLTLSYPGFPTITRSLQVPSKGAIEVAGEKARKSYEPYLFRFKTQIEITSDPIGAAVNLNNIQYKDKTPFSIEWEVGVPLNIEMSKAGFQELTGFSLNTLEEMAEIEDHRLWDFAVLEEENKKYIVKGLFKKFISISSLPSDATFYLDGSPTPTGKTGSTQAVALSVGTHDILFAKAGFNSKRVTVNVDADGPKSIFATLTRNVRFFAKDATDPYDNEIGATIARIYRQGQSFSSNDKTPCEIALPPVNHKVLFKKKGYKDAVELVSPTSKVVVAKMEPESMVIEVMVTDALNGLPIKNAQISYASLSGETPGETYLGATNDDGICQNEIASGEYTITVKKFGYFDKSANFNTAGGNNKLTFKLIIQ